MNEGEVYFTIFGDEFDPDQATLALGIEPSRVTRKADLRPKFSAWDLSSGKVVSEVVDVYEMAEGLVDQLESKADKIASLMKTHHLQANLNVVLTFSSDTQLSTPAIGFNERVVQFLAKVGAAIDVDTYRG